MMYGGSYSPKGNRMQLIKVDSPQMLRSFWHRPVYSISGSRYKIYRAGWEWLSRRLRLPRYRGVPLERVIKKPKLTDKRCETSVCNDPLHRDSQGGSRAARGVADPDRRGAASG
jgi:hypothetical protein